MAQGTWKVDSNKNKKLQEASRPWWDMPGVKDWWDDFTSDVKHRKPMSMKEMNPNSTPKAAVELMTKYNAAENKTIFGQNKPVRIPYTSKEHGAGTLYISSQTNGEVKFNPTELNQPSYDRTKAQLQALGIVANLPAIVAPVVSGIAGRANIRANLNLLGRQRGITNALQIATSKPTNPNAFYSGLPPQPKNRINSNLVAQAKQLRNRGKQDITPKVTNPDPPTIRQLKRELKKADTRIEKGSQTDTPKTPSGRTTNSATEVKKNGFGSTKVSKDDQALLDRAIDVVSEELINIENKISSIGPRNKKNTKEIAQLNKTKGEYLRRVSSLQTLLLNDDSKNDQQLLTGIDTALSFKTSKAAQAIVGEENKHYNRWADKIRIIPNSEIHHVNWLQAGALPYIRGRIPHEVRRESLNRMADKGIYYSNVDPNAEALNSRDTHKQAHGGNFTTNRSSLPGLQQVLSRLNTLGPNASAKDIVKELTKLNKITQAATDTAVLSKENQGIARDYVKNLILPPNYNKLSIDSRSIHNQSFKDAVKASGNLERQIGHSRSRLRINP